jgi:3'(2'), 5'-bisphosphate nucleotidase
MYEQELKAMMKAAFDAEVKIKEVYEQHFDVELKSDHSPVTAADKGADELIRKELHSSFPTYALLTEESKDDKTRLDNDYVFIVDPVDGTMEFVARNGEFCTNIALAYKHEVVVGVINIPLKDVCYYAIKGQGAYRLTKGGQPERIHVSNRGDGEIKVVSSRSFLKDEEKELMKKNAKHFASTSTLGAALKFCAIAEGSADLSYRLGGSTKEWDIAAGDLILHEAGGVVVKPEGGSYRYNRDDVYNHEGYILANKKENIFR